jgi:hypothetical protein
MTALTENRDMLGAMVAVLGGCTLESGACAIWIAIKIGNVVDWSCCLGCQGLTQGVSQLSPQSWWQNVEL